MAKSKINNFNLIAPRIFTDLVEKYGYVLDDIRTNELNGMDWSAVHTYTNLEKKLKIEIKQEPYYTDYGFSFIIYNIENKEYSILYNVPHEEQDQQDNFLTDAYDYIFSNIEILDLILGKTWKKLKD